MEKPTIDANYYKLLRELQEIDFVLVELTLYLDTHPEDATALKQYNKFALKRQGVAVEYEKRYGPLLHFGHSYSRYPWQWSESPWPWQV
jgi:spore coat protein JB